MKSLTRPDKEISPAFNAFWDAYPKRVARKDAWKAWTQINPTPALLVTILDALAWQTRQPDWLRDGGKFVPHPGTWLRAERWDDERTTLPRISERTIAVAQAVDEFLNDGRR